MIKRNDWIWIQYKPCEVFMPELSQSTLTRLLYLATFTDNNGVVVRYDNEYGIKYRVKKSELPSLLKVTPRVFKDFVIELKKFGVLIADKNGCELKTNMLFSSRTKEHKVAGCKLAHINKTAIRTLYEQVEVQNHKRLGALFRMIPFVHPKTNMLCVNPFVEYDDDIEPLSFKDYCVFIGYERDHTDRIYHYIDKLTLAPKTGEECCPLKYSANKKQVYISPLLFTTNLKDTKEEEL